MEQNVKTANQSTDSIESLAIVSVIMTCLQQTLRHAQSVTSERFRVTGYAVFLLLNVVAVSFSGRQAVAQPTLTPENSLAKADTSPASPTMSGRNNPDFLTGPAFENALERIQSLSWQGQQLRTGLQQMSTNRQIAILLDRRVDPGQLLSLQVRNVSLRALLDLIASEARADVSILGSVVYIGPQTTTTRLRTVEEMLSSELVSTNTIAGETGRQSSSSTRRTFELLERQTLNWADLTTPQELLEEIGRHYSLKIESIELIPHDLWGAAVLPSATSTQMLLAVLAQFELSFEWTPEYDGIQIVRMPSEPHIERQFTLRVGTEKEIIAELNRRMPGLERRVSGRRIIVAGTVEQLETVEGLIHPERHKPRPAKRNPGAGITTFTFAADAPLLAFMNTLQKQAGYTFKYDQDALEKAGIRLDKRIRLEAKELNAEEVFRLMFDAQNIAFKIDGKTVYLTPMPTSK